MSLCFLSLSNFITNVGAPKFSYPKLALWACWVEVSDQDWIEGVYCILEIAQYDLPCSCFSVANIHRFVAHFKWHNTLCSNNTGWLLHHNGFQCVIHMLGSALEKQLYTDWQYLCPRRLFPIYNPEKGDPLIN